jgi:hypothetical protein
MINITNLFSGEPIKSKETKIKDSKTNPSPALNQGKKYKKYQNKIENSLEKNAIKLSGKEGYANLNGNSLTKETQNVISQNNYTNQQQNINDLRQEYHSTLKQYESLINQINGNVTGYMERTNPNNPYLNKVVSFSNGTVCYVTNQGVAKGITSTQIWQTLNIPQTVQVTLEIPWLSSYNTPGTQIPTKPPLISGTALVSGQSVGNEGSNVFVNEFLPSDVNPNYIGCYAANSSNNNVTFIGGSPPPLNGPQIQNGNFSQPVLQNNTYEYITSSSTVPGWYFGGACLINNSTAWEFAMPYPGGNQCVSIQDVCYMYCTLNLSTGVNYTLTFSACSRPCCNSTNVGNPINLQLYTSSNAFISTIANFTPSPVNTWQNFSYTFTVPTTQIYNLYFYGTNTNGDQSTAIANVALNSTNTAAGSYSYSDCQQAAINSGYQYFGLQNANTSTGLGYCAVSNSQPAITQYGISTVPSKAISLWSSNTSNQTGNSAILSVTGSLQVINSSGQAVYSSPSTNANPPNYLGCYGDKSTRAMTSNANNGSQSFDLSGCLQKAEDGGFQYFGLQNSTSGKNAQCFLSNNISQTMEYGPATNCTQISDGSWSGGGWSNAVYNTTLPQSNYFLILQDDGNMCIYRGTGPSDNQGFIWCSGTNGQTQAANPAMTSQNGFNGQNWIASGTTLAAGDFIGSTNGNLALVMQTDGNLVLYTYQMQTNCQRMNDGNMGGGVGGNAMYNIGMTAVPQNMGQLAYIDADSNLYTYPSTNITYSGNYSVFNNSTTTGNDLQNGSTANTTVSNCQTACDNNADCAGFVFDNSNSTCYQKSYNMYPYGSGSLTNSVNTDIYIKSRMPLSPPLGVSQNTNGTDTVTYQNYNNQGPVGAEYGLSNATSVQKQQLQQLQDKMNLLSRSISDLTSDFQTGSINAERQSTKNVTGIQNYLTDIERTNVEIGSVANQNSGNVQNILNDSDIVVLQKNYNYLLWSILAAGTVLISMNIVKK